MHFLSIVLIRGLIFDSLGIEKYLLQLEIELKYQMKACV